MTDRRNRPATVRGRYSKNKPGTKEYILENIKKQSAPYENMNECWIWQRTINFRNGYGVFSLNKKTIMAHRSSFQIFGGELTKEKPLVCHKCDIKICVNPEHLYAGSYADNLTDSYNRTDRARTQAYGEFSPKPNAKLTPIQVKEIRKIGCGKPQREIAKQFSVSQRTIGRILHRNSWKEY